MRQAHILCPLVLLLLTNPSLAQDRMLRKLEPNRKSKTHKKIVPESTMDTDSTKTTARTPTSDSTIVFRQAHRGNAPAPPLPGKKGVGLTMRPEGRPGSWVEHLPRLLALDPYWSYSWNYQRIAAHPPYIEFIPMLWGARDIPERMEEILADPRNKRVLGFNEPDHPKQANMTVDKAVREWTDNLVPSIRQSKMEKNTVSLISPSPAHPAGPWMQSFMARVEDNDTMDWIAVHWYDKPNVTLFQRQLKLYYELYGNRPLLITEFAVADWPAKSLDSHRYSPDQVLQFMKEVLPWLEATPWIAGYAWFSFPVTSVPGTSSALFHGNGTLTPLGEFYATVRTERPQGQLL